MNSKVALSLSIGAGLLLGAPAFPAQESPETPVPALVNQREPLPDVRTGGAPTTPDGFAALAAEGYVTYVDTRAAEEVTPEFVAAVEAAGLRYVHLPIAGEHGLDLASARTLDGILDDEAAGPTVVACRTGNRAAALLAVKAHWLDGLPPEEALALGAEAGLTKLEPSVRILLGLPPLEPAESSPESESPPQQP
jgi:uncharacterized protein (TIGR01244 family)